MTTVIKRGLGSRRDVQILITLIILGAAVLVWAGIFSHRLRKLPLEPMLEQTPEEVVKLGALARGPARMVVYKHDEMAHVVSYAAAQHPVTLGWRGVPAGSVITVNKIRVDGNEVWVEGLVQQRGDDQPAVIHGSFLEPYTPLLLDKTLEVSGVKLISFTEAGKERRALNGWVRNVGSTVISQCVVTCTFQDRRENPVEVFHTETLTLPVQTLVRFHTPMTQKSFASISIQISYATPDGLRNYLPQVAIKKSSL